jgi:hypothetical protein
MSTRKISRASEKHIGEALELPVKEDQKSENGDRSIVITALLQDM